MFKSKLLIFCFFLIAYGGSNQWEKRSADLTSCDISKILFVNNDTGFVFGDSGFIARTTDSGNTWDDISISQDIRIGDACFISPNHIIAVGENGNFITSDDFGENWDISIVNMEYDNIRVFSFDGKNIWIVGRNGIICKSSIIQAFIMNRPYSINQLNRNRNLILFNLLGQYLHAIPRTNQLVIKKTGSKYNKSILAGNDKSHAINKK